MTKVVKKTSAHDKAGTPWAKLSDVKEGDVLITDGGFTCMGGGERKVVRRDQSRPDGMQLYLDCREGGHYLDGQADDGEHLVGLYRA